MSNTQSVAPEVPHPDEVAGFVATQMVEKAVAAAQKRLSRALAHNLSPEHPQDTMQKAMRVAEAMALLGGLQELHHAMTGEYAPGALGS